MKHGWLVFQRRGALVALFGFFFAAAPAAVNAQLHSRTRPATQSTESGTVLNNMSPDGVSGSSMIRRGELQNAAIINTGYVEGTSLKPTDMRDADLWARAIIHADGTYTETEKKDPSNRTVIQKTMSANGVLLQERIIMADGQGLPSEVMIKDATGQLKYRGVLVYDRGGRFSEEQLYDMDNQLLRRRIQDYGPNGEPKLRVVDYVKNLPADIQLVITQDTAAGSDSEQARRNYDQFRREAREVSASSASGEKKPGLLSRIFGRKKKD